MERKKGYYNYIEMLLALREHYMQLQSAIDLMQDKIYIDSKVPYKATISLCGRNEWFGKGTYIPYLLLTVKKEKNLLDRLNPHVVDDIREDAVLKLIEDDGVLHFEPLYDNPYYNPVVIIPNQDNEEFNAIYRDIQNSFFYEAPDFVRQLNPFQRIDVRNNGMGLNSIGFGKDMNIRYEATDDSIHFRCNGEFNEDFVRTVLRTAIPSFEVPSDYYPVLDSSVYDITKINFEEALRKKDELSIEREPGVLTLKRVSK